MPQAYSHCYSAVSRPAERPSCPKCKCRMMLARIERGRNDSNLRSFECPECKQVKRVLVDDPTKSTKEGWRDTWLNMPSKIVSLIRSLIVVCLER
jgi:transposase-like protein